MAYKQESPIPVKEGGTGEITFPLDGVLLGDGTGGITSTAAGTNGQVLIGATSADPAFATLTSSGSTLTYTPGVNTLNIDITSPLNVSHGGTGNVSLTVHGVLVGESSSAINATVAGTTGQVLIGSTGADPSFGALGVNSSLTSNGVLLGNNLSAITATAAGTTGQVLTGVTGGAPTFQAPASSSITITGDSGGGLTGNSFTVTGGSTGLTFSGAGTTETLTGTLDVANGGTGAVTFTSHGVLLGNSTGAVAATTAGTTGQVLTGVTGGAPTFQTPASTSITVTGDSGGGLTGNSFTFTGGTTGLTFSGSGTTETLTGTLGVANGGTGAATLTGILIGNGTSAVTANPITQYDTLIGGASNAITSVAPSSTAGIPLVSGGAAANPSYTTAVVAGGGTGATTLTSHGVLLGNGTSAITATTAGTTGQVLTGVTGSAPTFQSPAASSITITGDSGGGLTGASFTFTGGTTGLTFSGSGTTETLTGTLGVPNGGTGAATLTGVLIGNGSSAVTGNLITQHDVLIGGTGNGISSLAPSATSGVPLISQGSSTNPAFGTVVVAGGGTGATTLTSNGVLLGNGTGAVTATTAGTTGQVLTGVTGSAPTFQSPSASSITITGDSGGGLTGNSFTITGGTTGLTFSGSGTTETATGTLNVAHGGTGDSSLTAYAVLCGGTTTTSAVQSIASVGTSGQVLTSNGASALPTFQTAAASGIVTLDGNSGAATGSTVTITTGASNAEGTATFAGSGSTVKLAFTDANQNVGIGTLALGHPAIGGNNVAVGPSALGALTTGSFNIGIGQGAGGLITSAAYHIYIGYAAGPGSTGSGETVIGTNAYGSSTGSNNIVIGSSAGFAAGTVGGAYNIVMGLNSGSSYESSESSNILLNSTGTLAESHVLRIGSGTGTGTQNLNKAFISGITGINAGSIASVATIATTNQLGSATITAGTGITVTPTANTITIASSVTPVTTINGNSGSATGSTITITTGASSAQGTSLFTASGSTVTHTFMGSNSNIGLGTSALAAVTSGGSNTAFGAGALQATTTSSANTAFGYQAGNTLTGGGANNTAVGYQAMSAGAGATSNSALGFQALQNVTGTENVGIGYSAGTGVTSGGSNVMIGNAAGSAGSIGSNNIYISNSGAAESNTIRIGTSGTQTVNIQAGISGATSSSGVAVLVNSGGTLGTTTSSIRYKEDISPISEEEADLLLSLEPVSFTYKEDIDKRKQYGLIAENVLDIMPELVTYNENGEVHAIRYHLLYALLLDRVQRDTARIDALEKRVKKLESILKRG
jgi:endosialidase-like protein